MIIVLSGEGSSDLGTCTNRQDECSVPDFRYGPMTLLIDKEIEKNHQYSPLEVHEGGYVFISKPRLSDLMRTKSARKIALRGKKILMLKEVFSSTMPGCWEKKHSGIQKNGERQPLLFFSATVMVTIKVALNFGVLK